MSTFKVATLAVLAFATLTVSIGAYRPQTGPEPVVLGGPRKVSSGGTYTYTVTVSSGSNAVAVASPFDTSVAISTDNSDNWIDLPATVTIPGGQTSASFEATVSPDAEFSIDTLTASNANGAVSAEILVEE